MKFMLLIHQGTTPTPRSPEEWGRLSEDEQNAVYAGLPGDQRDAGRDARPRAGRPRDRQHRAGAGRQDPDHRRPVRGDQGGHRRLLSTSRPTTSTRRSPWQHGSRRPAWAAPSRCDRSRSGDEPRSGLPRPVGLRPRCPDRLPRRLRPRRGSRAGVVRDRGGALAAGRSPRQPGRLARDDGAQPGHQSHSPRSHAGGEDPPARGAGGSGGHRGRDDLSRRAARAALHVLPSGPRHRGAGRAHAAHPGRPDDARDRPRLPGRPSRRWRSGSCGPSTRSRRPESRSACRPPSCCPTGSRPCWRSST